MSEFIPGGADEVVRILWISDFRNEAQGLFGHIRRASEEFKKAAAEQRRSNAITMKTARDAAEAAKAAQAAQREELREYQSLLQRRTTLNKDRLQAEKRLAAEEEKLAKKSQTNREALEKIERNFERQRKAERKADAAERKPVLARLLKAERDLVVEHGKAMHELQEKAANDRIDLADVYEGRALQKQRTRRTRQERDEKKELARRQKFEMDALRDSFRPELDVLDRALAERLTKIDENFEIEKAKQADANRALLDQINERIKIRRLELADAEKIIQRLEDLEKAHPGVSDILQRHRGAQRDRGLDLAMLELNKETIEAQFSLFRFQDSLKALRQEAIQTRRVTPEMWGDFVERAKEAKLTTQQFNDELKIAGLEVRNFGDEKNRELRILKQNTTQLGDHNRVMNAARGAWRHVSEQMRLSTNEMILFARLMRLLLIPVFAAFIGVALAGIADLIGGFAALASSIAPIAGQAAALPVLFLAAAQAMAVWKIATDNLGKSSNSLGKVIQTALTGSTKDFDKLIRQLPPTVARFANVIREDLMPGFRLLRAELQEHIFTAFTNGLQRVVPALSPLREQVVTTAQVIRKAIDAFSRGISTPQFVTDFREQMEVTNRFLSAMIPILGRIGDGFLGILRAADPVVSNLLELADRFSRWVAGIGNMGRSGGLTRFFEASNEALNRTLNILGHIGGAFVNIGRIAYRVVGRQLLIDLERVSGEFMAWTSSAGGIRAITRYFKELQPALYEAGRLLRDVVKEMFRFSGDPALFNILRQLRVEALPALSDAFRSAMQTLAPAIIDFLVAFARALAAISKEGGGIVLVLRSFRFFFDAVADFVGTPLGKLFLDALAFIAVWRSARFLSAVTGLRIFSRILGGIVAMLVLGATRANLFNAALARTGLVQRATPTLIRQPGVARQAGVAATFFGLGGGAGGLRAARERAGEIRAANRAGVTVARLGEPGGPQSVFVPSAGGGGTSRFGTVLRSQGFQQAGAVGGTAAFIAGSAMGGRTGSVLGGIGLGAAVGSAFPGLGTAIGAVVGGLGGLAFSLLTAKDSVDQFALSVQKFSRERQEASLARRQIPQARLAVERAAFQFRQARANRRQLESVVGIDPQVLRDARLTEREAFAAFRSAQQHLQALKKEVAQGAKATNQQVKTTSDEIAAIFEAAARRPVRALVGPGRTGDPEKRRVEFAADKIRDMANNIQNPKLKSAVMAVADMVSKWNTLKDKNLTLTITVLRRVLGGSAPQGPAPPTVQPSPDVRDRRAESQARQAAEAAAAAAAAAAKRTKEDAAARRAAKLAAQEAARLEAAMQAAADAAVTFADEATRLANVISNLRTGFEQGLEVARARFDQNLMRKNIDPSGLRATRLQATFDIRALKRSIDFSKTIEILMRQQLAALNSQLSSLVASKAEPSEIAAVQQEISALELEIGQLAVDRINAVTEIIRNQRLRRQSFLDSLIERTGLTSERRGLKLENIELRQQLAGTFDTPGGSQARAAFINNRIIPGLQAEIRALEKKRRDATTTIEERRSLGIQIQQKQNEILEAQLAAQEAIKDNTEQIERNTGNLSFEFQGQRFTDMVGLGIGV